MLSFKGLKLGEVAEVPSPDKSRRWYTLGLYRLEGDTRFVVSIRYWSSFENEPDETIAEVFEDQDSLVEFLTTQFDPMEFVQGFPDTPKFKTRQEALERRINADFDSRVGLLFARSGITEVV
tara:strand:+ start:131 stop:496 length:366 start_codon:yes stop_codon:yes gene_type:complete